MQNPSIKYKSVKPCWFQTITCLGRDIDTMKVVSWLSQTFAGLLSECVQAIQTRAGGRRHCEGLSRDAVWHHAGAESVPHHRIVCPRRDELHCRPYWLADRAGGEDAAADDPSILDQGIGVLFVFEKAPVDDLRYGTGDDPAMLHFKTGKIHTFCGWHPAPIRERFKWKVFGCTLDLWTMPCSEMDVIKPWKNNKYLIAEVFYFYFFSPLQLLCINVNIARNFQQC